MNDEHTTEKRAAELKPAPAVNGRHGGAEPPTESATAPAESQVPSAAIKTARPRWLTRRVVIAIAVAAVAGGAGIAAIPWIQRMLSTVSTDDAYVNGHATIVAPRVAGQVAEVLVDDNQRVRKGTLLVRLDREPFEVQVRTQQAAVAAADADVTAAKAEARGLEALARSQRWKLQTTIEQVGNQVAALKAAVAVLYSREATQVQATADFRRAEKLAPERTITREELDQRRAALEVANADVDAAREQVYQIRVALGLSREPKSGNLAEVPEGWEQNVSQVRMALADVVSTLTKLGLPLSSSESTPEQVMEEFRRMDKQGDIDRILAQIVPNAPGVKQAQARLEQARSDLAQAELNLRYCDVRAEIDGIITRRNINPGNHVQVGESLMAIRSVNDIWIDANFKETQLGELRIGQHVDLYVDMYGESRKFSGRISGFSMGTGSTLALLPPQNATGNFVKVVQRLPVRIDLVQGNPPDTPLFIGLSVVPYVHIDAPPTGENAGQLLQAYAAPSRTLR